MNEKKSAIYCIECLKTEKKYIGSTVNVYNRWRQHKSKLKRNYSDNPLLQEDYNRYGIDSFEITILENVEIKDKANLLSREQYWMDFYKSYDPQFGYNKNSNAKNGENNSTRDGRMAMLSDPERKKTWIERQKNCELFTDPAKKERWISNIKNKMQQEATRNKCSVSQIAYNKNNPESRKRLNLKISKGRGCKPFKVFLNNNELGVFENQMDASRKFNVQSISISKCLRGLQKSAKGYCFRFLEHTREISG